MSDGTFDRVRKVIAETQRIPAESIKPESTFADLNIDSMDAVNIVFGLENEFDISIPDDDMRSIRDLQGAVDGVDKLLAAKAAKAG